ncbi:hypothetical protein N7523_007536 [Penicillium sp. IBT 18751x]|nr:hypothetical protein N7523_007536 [Penicillium sp. IBT 18751x]
MAGLPERYLAWMEGSTISFSESPEAQWVLDNFLGGDADILPEHEVKDYGPCYATAKLSVHHADEGTQGFIRVYRQIPWENTLFHTAAQRSQQAVELPDFGELKAMEALKNCEVVARMKFMDRGAQPQDSPVVPGGFYANLLWLRVPGEPLEEKVFWSWTRPECDEFRECFRLAWLPLASTLCIHMCPLPQKIIYDKVNKSIHFAGFREPELLTTTPPWDPKIWVQYHLAKFPAVRPPGWFENIECWDW